MNPTNYRDDLIPQDTAEDDFSLGTATSQPLSEAEIAELLYGEGRSTDERLSLLRSLRDDLAERAGGDFGDDDPGDLIAEIDERISELAGDADSGTGGMLDTDPLAHRETLSPDSDELEQLDEEEEDSLDEEDDWLDAEDRQRQGAPDGVEGKDDDDDEDEPK